MISLINDFLITNHRPTLGYLNPWLYGLAAHVPPGQNGLNDITVGSNPGCGTQGFPAAPGWDPVTGLGTLNLEMLLRLTPWP